jgi:hypothetical protein
VSLRFVKGRFRAEPWGSKDAAEAGAGSIAGRVSRRGGRIGTEMIWIRCNDGDSSSSSETEGLLGNQRAHTGKEPEGGRASSASYRVHKSTIDYRLSAMDHRRVLMTPGHGCGCGCCGGRAGRVAARVTGSAGMRHQTNSTILLWDALGIAGWPSLVCTRPALAVTPRCPAPGLGRGLPNCGWWLGLRHVSQSHSTPSTPALDAPNAQPRQGTHGIRPSLAPRSLLAPWLAQTKPSSCRRHTGTELLGHVSSHSNTVWPACQVGPSFTRSPPALRDRTPGAYWPKTPTSETRDPRPKTQDRSQHVSTHLLHHDIIRHPAASCSESPVLIASSMSTHDDYMSK